MRVPIGLVLALLATVVVFAAYLFPTHEQVGQALQQGGRLDEALQYYLAAMRADPTDEPIRVRVASVYEQRGQPDDAIALYRELTVLDPNDLGYRRQLATLYDWSLRIDESMAQKEKIAELDPKDVATRLSLADYYVLQRKDYAAATRMLEQVVAVRPNDADALMELARLYTQTHRIPEALETYRRAQQEDPDNPAVGRALARLQSWNTQMQEAIARDRQTLEASPTDAATLANLEALLRRTGQEAEAETIRQQRAAATGAPAGTGEQ